MRLRYLDLIGGGLITFVTLMAALLGVFSEASQFQVWFWPFGILMVLFIPGYVLTLAILPHLDHTTTFLLSLGISISMDILGGLILHYTPWGLQPVAWAIWLGAISLPSCLVAAYRRRQASSGITVDRVGLGLNGGVIASFLVTGILIAVAIFIGRYYTVGSGNTFTQLWAIPVRNWDGYAVQIGIHNWESKATHYDLIIESRGKTIDQWSNIEISAGETWEVDLPLEEKPLYPVTFLLFKANARDEVYRMTRLMPATFDRIISPTADQ